MVCKLVSEVRIESPRFGTPFMKVNVPLRTSDPIYLRTLHRYALYTGSAGIALSGFLSL